MKAITKLRPGKSSGSDGTLEKVFQQGNLVQDRVERSEDLREVIIITMYNAEAVTGEVRVAHRPIDQYTNFVDLSESYDTVSCNSLWKTLAHLG